MLPSVALVRVEPSRDHVVVVEDLELPRGDWQSGSLEAYVAFGAPGTPIAVDAHLVPAAPEADAGAGEPGERLTVEPALRPDPAGLVVGRPQMAGVVVRVREPQLRRVFDTAGAAILRLRSLLSPPAPDLTGARDVVARLGTADGSPLTLRRVEVAPGAGQPAVARAEATLCGADADPWPLAVSLGSGRDAPAEQPVKPTITPDAATRHASDDLCIRWWAAR
jgi:hypothetical protein